MVAVTIQVADPQISFSYFFCRWDASPSTFILGTGSGMRDRRVESLSHQLISGIMIFPAYTLLIVSIIP